MNRSGESCIMLQSECSRGAVESHFEKDSSSIWTQVKMVGSISIFFFVYKQDGFCRIIFRRTVVIFIRGKIIH